MTPSSTGCAETMATLKVMVPELKVYEDSDLINYNTWQGKKKQSRRWRTTTAHPTMMIRPTLTTTAQASSRQTRRG